MKKNETDNYKNFAAVVNANKESDLQVIARLEQENAILKSQIEKMKDCMTCIHNLDSQYFCTCDLGTEEQSKCCYKNNRDKWELAE